MPHPARADGRRLDELRPVSFEAGFAPHATGSVLIRYGSTQVICAATIDPGVPTWMKQQGVKGGWLAVVHRYPSEMAQNFWTAIYAWSTCFLVTIVVSLLTRAPEESKLVGLVYSLTPRPEEEPLAWYARPASLAIMVVAGTVLLNIVFW